MDSNNNNWRPAQPDPPPIDAGDWRSQLQPDSRHRIVNKIMETLKRHLPFSGQEGLLELKKIAVRFEEKIYSAATNQSDYLRKISLKMLTMETKSQNTVAGSLAANTSTSGRNPMEQVPQSMQPQGLNQGQPVPMPLAANQSQSRQQMLAQNLPGNIASAGIQTSSGLASTMPPVSGMTQNPISNVINQTSMPNMVDTSQTAVGSSMGGQGMASNVFNNQKLVPGRQQVPQGQQQSQQQYLYQQQLQQQFMKQKQLQQGNIPNSLMQSHIQQQQQQHNVIPNQMQLSQQSGISTSNAMLQQHPQSSLGSVHQSGQSLIQQHPQSVLRQQQQPQQQMAHDSTVSPQLQTSQTQQPLMGQQTNMQPTQILGQQNISDLTQQQQQRLMTQQNNHSNMQQQQLIAQQTNLTNMQQQHMGHQSNMTGMQQQLHATQPSTAGMQANQHQMHLLHQNKTAVQQQHQQSASSLQVNQGQQSQPQMVSQIQSQSAQLQQQLGMNQQQRDMQQRLQPSGTLMQPHNIADQQKQMYQSQRALPEASSTSMESASQSGQANSTDWQEEVHKKITVMKEKYLPEVNELYQKISLKVQQHDSLPEPPKSEQFEKLRMFKTMLERIIAFLQVSKINVNHNHREKLVSYEKQIVNFLNSNRGPRKPGQIPPHMQPMIQTQSQNMPSQSHENQMNHQLQPATVQGPGIMQQNTSSMQQNQMPSLSGVSNLHQNLISSVQPGQNIDAGQGGGLVSMQQGVGGHNSVNAPLQTNMTTMSSQNGINLLQPNISNIQSGSGVNPQQHVKEQQIMQNQQRQMQQRQMQQQMLQSQLLQQQQLHQQAKQQSRQMSAHQLPQNQQMSEVNDMNIRQGLGAKPGVFPQHHAAGQRSLYHQQIKPGVPFPVPPSPQMLQSSSPQILQNSSPLMDQQNMLSSLSKTGTPLQSANSPFVVPSPSTPLAPSPMPGDLEKPNSNVSALTNVGNTRLQQSAVLPAPTQSLAIGTTGISASPLLADFSNQDASHGTTAVVAKSSAANQPLDRLIKAVKSISNEAFTAAVNDIGSVVSMIDRIAGSAPGNGSRAAVGEDLVAMTKCRLQAKNFVTQDGSSGSKKMKRFTSAMPLIVVSTNGSVNDSFKQLVGSELSDCESTATSRAKRSRNEINHSIIEEIREINQRLIETILAISDEDVDPSVAADVAAPEGGDGVIVKCSYNAVGLSPNLKSQYATAQMSPIQPLRLLVPSNYPNCSPVLLDKLPVDVSGENEDLSMKAKSKFSISVRTLSQPMSLGDIARTWDFCARAVISEYAQASGGGSFSSSYGSWESVVST